jgi:hypothetical protein
VVAGHGDTVYAAWRKVYPGNRRAVVVARSADGGRTWAVPVAAQRDGWVIDGCPHAGPSLQVDAAGRVHVAWWSGKQGAAGVFYARSDDGGRTFGAPVPIGVAEYSRPAHVQMAVTDGAAPNGSTPNASTPDAGPTVVLAWDDGTVQQPRVMVRVSRDGGATFAPAVPASASGRPATFPVLALSGGQITLAWSEDANASAAESEHHMGHGDKPMHMPLPAVGQQRIVMRDARLAVPAGN